ncbi:uncharacterized protein TNIN_63661 [Trichonephila inaurata madagascariensis]|uniref:Uncharacterized protein n=1 Tax=Trichonephila inaurata madagascariensis TaxID=2747483 RepID=A0A8X6IRG2_9ARAC|nr:uncharacterized protein TNIN_63661 [Trichonephila inaurata madagascariensis]
MDSDGRYVVSLPWIRPSPPYSRAKSAERRLKNCINSLKKTGNLEAYEGVFSEWLQEGVIEKWHLKTDSLTINLRYCVEDDPGTKKENFVNPVHKIFDPLGFTCPFTLGPRPLQECWKLKSVRTRDSPPLLVKI